MNAVETSKILDLTKALIRIPSITGDLERSRNVLDIAQAELGGFTCEEFTEPKTGTRSLLFYNTDTRPNRFRVLLNGHLDVVPGKQTQFDPREENGLLVARGADDMKGGAAGIVLVFKALARQLPYPIALQLVTDEEVGGFNGANYQVKQGVKADLVISAESTDLNIKNEMKGVLVLEARASGRSAHAARPEEGDNASVKMARFIVGVADEFPVPQPGEWTTTMNVGGIYTPNTAHNKVPDSSNAVLDFRHIPSDTKASLVRRTKSLAPEGVKIKELKDQNGVAVYTDPSHPDLELLASTIEAVTGEPARFTRAPGSSDSRHFVEGGAVTVDFGPKGAGLHTDYEYGDIESYGQFAEVLVRFLTSLQ